MQSTYCTRRRCSILIFIICNIPENCNIFSPLNLKKNRFTIKHSELIVYLYIFISPQEINKLWSHTVKLLCIYYTWL